MSHTHPLSWRRWALPILVLTTARLVAADAPPPAEAKPYVLFMGADLELQEARGQPLRRVETMKKGSLVIRVDGEEVLVPTDGPKAPAVKLSKNLKLADRFVHADAFKVQRVYSPGRDPFRALANSAGHAAAIESISEQNLQRVVALTAPAPSTGGSAGGNPAAELVPNPPPLQEEAIRRLNDANMALNSNMNDIGQHVDRMAAEAGKQEYDALELVLRLSSDQPLSGAYFVAVVQYRAPGARSGDVASWIHAEELPPLDRTPRAINVREAGFPPGFELVRSEVHVYADGQEIGTNVADRSLRLTREEAHQYLVLEHLAQHKGGTLPPGVVLGLAAEDLAAYGDGARLQNVIYVKVNREGVPLGTFLDAELIRPAGAALERLVAVARFTPALRAGRAVDGVARIRIADLVRPTPVLPSR
jgi:hypothetical protein